MAPLDPFSDMIQLGPSVYLYEPTNQAHDASASEPKLVILCTWMAASATHVAKYIVGYQVLFPSCRILLVRSEALDILYRSSAVLRRRIEPALAVIQSTCSQEPLSPEILLHVFSNAGSHQSINLLRNYYSQTGNVFPIHAHVLDSCPGRGDFQRSYLALSAPLDRQPAYLRLPGSLAAVLILCLFWIISLSLRLGDPIETIRHDLNDKSIARETKRIYIYSDVDPIIHWQEVEAHAEDAKIKGDEVEMVKFEGSGHAAHVRLGGGARYWKTVKKLWIQSSVSTK